MEPIKDHQLGKSILDTLDTLFGYSEGVFSFTDFVKDFKSLRTNLKTSKYCTDIMDLEMSDRMLHKMLNTSVDTHDIYRFAFELTDYFIYFANLQNEKETKSTDEKLLTTLEADTMSIYIHYLMSKLSEFEKLRFKIGNDGFRDTSGKNFLAVLDGFIDAIFPELIKVTHKYDVHDVDIDKLQTNCKQLVRVIRYNSYEVDDFNFSFQIYHKEAMDALGLMVYEYDKLGTLGGK